MMKVIELIKELEKYPADCEIKVNCIMVRSGWQYTYHAALTAGRINQPRKSENVVTINPVIFNSYGMKVVAMNSGVPIIKLQELILIRLKNSASYLIVKFRIYSYLKTNKADEMDGIYL